MTVEASDTTALDLVLALHMLVRSLRRSATTQALHPTQLLVLVQLAAAGPTRIGELAERVPCSQPTATAVAKQLEATGMVARVRDTSDGRATRLQLTDLGLETIRSAVSAQAEVLRRRLDELDSADSATVLAAAPLLRRMAHLPDLP
jgi:DNA-binding MarR family transcriptional regulator